jgi:hypothetical protein
LASEGLPGTKDSRSAQHTLRTWWSLDWAHCPYLWNQG